MDKEFVATVFLMLFSAVLFACVMIQLFGGVVK